MDNRDEQLTDNERLQIRNALRFFMMEHPALAPLRIRLLDGLEAASAQVTRAFVHPGGRFASAAMVLVLFAGAGTSYAAQSALPGDLLYPIKVNVNEKIAIALAGGPEAQAHVEADIASQRLQEAETLAAQNRLTPQTSADLASNLNQATASFNAAVAAMATSSTGITAAVDVQTDLETTLAAHAKVLAAISAAVPATDNAIVPIRLAVAAHVLAAHDMRTASEQQEIAADATSGTATLPIASTVHVTQALAQQAARNIAKLVQQLGTTPEASGTTTVMAQAQIVQAAVSAGEAHLQQGRIDSALSAFQSAIQTAAETETNVDASIQLKKILPGVSVVLASSTMNGDGGDLLAPSDSVPPSSTTASEDAQARAKKQ